MPHDEPEEKVERYQGLIIGSTVLAVLLLAVLLTFHTQIRSYLTRGSECFSLNTWVEGSINLILHVSIFALFVCVFFFTVVHSVEKLTIYRNLKSAVESILSDTEAAVGSPIYAVIDVDETPEQDAEIEQRARNLRIKAFRTFGLLLSLGVALSALLYGGMYAFAKKRYLCSTRQCCTTELKPGLHYPDIRRILYHNLVVLGFVFVTECFFLFGITLHYRSLDPNAIRRQFILSLMDKAGVPLDTPGTQVSKEAVHDLLEHAQQRSV